MDWAALYPAFAELEPERTIGREGELEGEGKAVRKISKQVTVADIGCGFGGLLVALSTKLPDELILGTTHPPIPPLPFHLTPSSSFYGPTHPNPHSQASKSAPKSSTT